MNPSRSLKLLAIVAPTAPVPAAATAPVVPPLSAIELAKALAPLAWPVAALVIAFTFHRAITQFVVALGSRISKLSLFKVELELIPATAAATTPLLDDALTSATAVQMGPSGVKQLSQQVLSDTPADYAVIDLGKGKEWLTSRLYIAAVMMQRMRGIKVFVFVEHAPGTERRLVVVASVRQLRWKLACRYPWLEAAWISALPRIFQEPPFNPLTGSQDFIASDTGRLAKEKADTLVSAFISSLQRKPPPEPDPNDAEWVTFGSTMQERSAWVTRDLLEKLLPPEAFDAWANEFRDASRARRTRAVLRRASPFVALVDDDHQFVRLADRQSLLDKIAATLGEEPELGPSDA